MNVVEFLRSKAFFKNYLLVTLITLIAMLFLNAFALTEIQIVKTIAGVLLVVGFALLLGLILLIFQLANRSDPLGRKILRFNYVTIIVLCNCFVYLMIAGLLMSFYLDPATTPIIGPLLAMLCFGIAVSFGICLSVMCYITISVTGTWIIPHDNFK